MDKNKLDALFAMQDAFPNIRFWVDGSNVLRCESWLVESEAQWFHNAQRMMEPA